MLVTQDVLEPGFSVSTRLSVFWSATYSLSVLCVEGLVSASSILMVKTRNKKVFASSFEFESLPRSVCCVEIMLG